MATNQKRNLSVEELAKAGVYVDVPKIEIAEDPSIEIPGPDTDLDAMARQESFMAERVKIRIASTTDPNAPPYCVVTVNDVSNRLVIPRNQVVTVKRMHVEVLARMRQTSYTQQTRNPMDPESGNALIPHHALAYPFEVVEDPNPAGRAWFERLMAEPSYF